jgi:hypothetical protein
MAREVRNFPLGVVGRLLEEEKIYLWKYMDGPLMASPSGQTQFPFDGIEVSKLEKKNV